VPKLDQVTSNLAVVHNAEEALLSDRNSIAEFEMLEKECIASVQ